MTTFEEKYAEFIKAVPIDKEDLDTEVVNQPELYRRIADEVCLREAALEDATRNFKRIEAIADKDIRQNLKKANPTETEIKRIICLDSRIIEAQDFLAKLTLTVERLKSLKESIAMRKDSFKALVQLHGDQYWSKSTSVTTTRSDLRDGVRKSIRDARGKE